MNLSKELKSIAFKFSNEYLIDILKTSNYFVALSGSISYGFADEYSDIEMEIYCDKPELQPKIAEILNKNPRYEGKEISTGITEWPIEKLLKNEIQPNIDNNLYFYDEISKALPLIDPENILLNAQNNLGYFSYQDQKRLARGLYLEIFELGLHLTEKLIKRDKYLEANISFHHAIESLARLAYVLNKDYFPHLKWLIAGLPTLNNDYGIVELFNTIGKEKDIMAKYKIYSTYVDTFKKDPILETFLSKEEINEPWTMIYDRDTYKFVTTVMY